MTNLVSYFEDAKQAARALGALRDHGVDVEHLSMITNETQLEELYTSAAAREAKARAKGITATTANDAATGALKGTGVGLGVGALGALASVFIPGWGLVFGGGALMTASLAAIGTGVSGGVAGAVTGFLKDQGLHESLIGKYEHAVHNAGAVVGVEIPDDVDSARIVNILKKYNGHGITNTKAVMKVEA